MLQLWKDEASGIAKALVHREGETSNPHDALLQELADWTTELNRLKSPALRTDKEAQP